MKKHFLKTIVLSVAGTILFSCENEEVIPQVQPDSVKLSVQDENKVKVMQEFAQLLGKTLAEKENREYLLSLVHARNDDSEAITVNALLGVNVSPEEMKLLNRSNRKGDLFKGGSFFKKEMIKEFSENESKYPYVADAVKRKSTFSRSTEDIFDELSEYFASQNLDVYFPYEENFNLAEENLITVTWDPLTNTPTTTGYTMEITNDGLSNQLTPIDEISDDYAWTSPTLVVRPADEVGSYTRELGMEDLLLLDPGDGGGGGNHHGGTPNWSVQGWQGLLTFNVDHTKITQDDVLKVSIPKIRLMEHLGTFYTPSRITLYNSSAILETNSLGYLVRPLKTQAQSLLIRKHIRRRDARKHNWITVNLLWDDDWDMHEADQWLCWGSHHWIQGSLNVTAKAGLAYDEENKKVVPELKFNIETENVRLGGNIRKQFEGRVSRRAVLSQIVGDSGAGVYWDGNTPYSIRTAGKMQFYFKPYLTKISNN